MVSKKAPTNQLTVGISGDSASSFVVVPTKLGSELLTVLDNRTGEIYDIPIKNQTIKATDFKKISTPMYKGKKLSKFNRFLFSKKALQSMIQDT